MTTRPLSSPDTICALATPPGAGSIAVIRVSGPRTFAILDRIFSGPRPSRQPSHTVRLGWLVDQNGNRKERPRINTDEHGSGPESGRRILYPRQSACIGGRLNRIDQVMLAVFRGPRSYTGEHMAEISCHGGTLIADTVIELLKRLGCRPAEPGEFARRAVIAGKLTLSQAEATLDLINARSPVALASALDRYQGGLSKLVLGLTEELRDLCTLAEHHLGFDESDADRPRKLDAGTRRLIGRLDRIIRQARRSRLLHEGAKVAIVGRPNVGKSSLFNRLLEQDRTLVTPEPGTTRDRVEAVALLGGVPVTLTDTAGLFGSTADGRRRSAVARLAADQTRNALTQADLVLAVFDGSERTTGTDLEVLAAVSARPAICVVNKFDRPRWREPRFLNGHPRIGVSALTGANIGRLRAAVARRFRAAPAAALAGTRHLELFSEAREALGRSLAAPDAETAALELGAALACLNQVDAPAPGSGTLDRIFADFCVGK